MISILFVAAVAVVAVVAMLRVEQQRRAKPGPSGCLEYRTDLPIDVCMDYLNNRNIHDEFEYECTRQPDGSYLLHFTLHRPSRQPVDTLYTLRLDPGHRTVITLIFLREAFGYREPVFGQELLDAFFAQKLNAERTK